MALLAQGGAPGGEQSIIDRAVGSVTQGAILRHRRVLPQERTAFLLVTAQAVVVERYLVQRAFPQATVGIMTVVTAGFALGNRVA